MAAAGAIALGLVGVFALGSDIWWTLWELSPSVVPEGAQALLMARNVAAAIVFVAAHALLAVGLWAARPARHAGAWRQTLMRLIGVAGTVALVADLWAVSRWLPTDLPAIT